MDDNVSARVLLNLVGVGDSSTNLFELLAMTVTALAFTVRGETPPSNYPEASIILREDNSSGVQWIHRYRGGRAPRSGAVVRMMGYLKMRSEWRFRAKHV